MAYLAAMFGIPTVGWILLIIGLKQRSHSRPHRHMDPRQQPPPPQARPPGTTLIIIGAVLLTLGVLAIIGRLAFADHQAMARNPALFRCCDVTPSHVPVPNNH